MDGSQGSVKLKQDNSQSQLHVGKKSHFARAAGILKYLRESSDHGLTLDPQSEDPTEYKIKCEYCGQELSPLLGEICLHFSKAALMFCCEQWEHLFRLLLKMRNVWEEKSESIPKANDKSASQHLVYRRKNTMSMFWMDATKEDKSETRRFEEYVIEMPALDTGTMRSNVMCFRLSCPSNGSWVKFPENENDKKANIFETNLNKDEMSVSICKHESLDFGLCRQQEDGDFILKYYVGGIKFLLAFHNGSAQVFYPSGLLAILVTENSYGRVCIVYDDTPGQTMRALFQSDGKGTCYHPSGNIWLIVDKYGGQCLDPGGARVRKWTWHKLGSTPLRPIFLFINKSIGIRVLGKQQIFVSFLANSRQAKFNIGAQNHLTSKERKMLPTLSKDELIALAASVKIKLLIQKCHRYMCTPSQPKMSYYAVLAPHLHLQAQKLFKAGKKVSMGKEDSDFFQNCLQECL